MLLLAAAVPMAGVLVKMLRRTQDRQVPETVHVPADVPEGLSILGAVIVFRNRSGEVRAYSSRCTHLGCRIDRVLDGEAACPCHGSRFHPDGTVARGPASQPLQAVRLEAEAGGKGWVARVVA